MACALCSNASIAYIHDASMVLLTLPHHFFISPSRLTDDLEDEITEFIKSDEATGLYNFFLTDRGRQQCWMLCFSDANTAFEAKLRFG